MTFVRGGGGVPEKRTYDVSRGHNRYVRLPLCILPIKIIKAGLANMFVSQLKLFDRQL